MSVIKTKIQKKLVKFSLIETYLLLDKYLPKKYVQKVQSNLQHKNIFVSNSLIKNVRNKSSKNINVLTALVEIALEEKKAIENLQLICNLEIRDQIDFLNIRILDIQHSGFYTDKEVEDFIKPLKNKLQNLINTLEVKEPFVYAVK